MQYRFLPPYSPNLNPIENVFSHIKSHFKALIATHYRQELINTFNMPCNQMAERRRILSVTFNQALSEVQNDVQSVTNAFNHLYEMTKSNIVKTFNGDVYCKRCMHRCRETGFG